MGNPLHDISKQDICERFGLNIFFLDTCNIDFPRNNKKWKIYGVGFIWAPVQVADAFIKLDGIKYYGNELRVENTTPTRKRTNNISIEFGRISVGLNNHLGNQTPIRTKTVSESASLERKKNCYFWRQHSS